MTNPGGPGASGILDLRITASNYPAELRARFDLVSFDPRGMGDSTKVECLDPPQLDALLALDPSPDTPDEQQALDAGQQQLADACEQRSAKLLPFLSTTATARDLDRIRAALGDKKLTFFGASYGTYLGAIYAQLFPKRVRALVLDGAMNPKLTSSQLLLEQAVGYEEALQAFLTYCSADANCSFNRSGNSAGAFDALAGRVDAEGIPGLLAPGRRLGPAEFQNNISALLSAGEPVWPLLGIGLDQADKGDASGFILGSDAINEAVDTQANVAIVCLGPLSSPPGDEAELASLAIEAPQRSPHFGAVNATAAGYCAKWPVRSKKPIRIRAKGAPPILIIGTEGDPATPLPWAKALAKQLRSGVLVTATGHTHTSFAQSRFSQPLQVIPPKQCVDDIGIRYLTELEIPADNTRCT